MHNEGFSGRKQWEETLHSEVKRIVTKDLNDKLQLDMIQIETANLYMDTKKSTDFVVLARKNNQDKQINIASRIRKGNCPFRDLTIRTSYYGSDNTEINKLQNTHFYFYAWCDNNNHIREYMIVNTRKLFESGLIEKYNYTECSNKDDENKFMFIPVRELIKEKCLLTYKINKNKL